MTRSLSARSTVVSLVLGAHPDPLTPAQLTRAATHFGIADSAARAALTRGVAGGDLRRDDGSYRLGERHVARQRRQAEAIEDAEREWDGTWELAVVVVTGRSGPDRAALREALVAARMAELREGVWTRPANLTRAPLRDDVLLTFTARPTDDAVALVARGWDLDAWSASGRALVDRLDETDDPAPRLAAAAALVSHLATDPLLPATLLPADWAGLDLRAAYADYQAELRDLLETDRS